MTSQPSIYNLVIPYQIKYEQKCTFKHYCLSVYGHVRMLAYILAHFTPTESYLLSLVRLHRECETWNRLVYAQIIKLSVKRGTEELSFLSSTHNGHTEPIMTPQLFLPQNQGQ